MRADRDKGLLEGLRRLGAASADLDEARPFFHNDVPSSTVFPSSVYLSAVLPLPFRILPPIRISLSTHAHSSSSHLVARSTSSLIRCTVTRVFRLSLSVPAPSPLVQGTRFGSHSCVAGSPGNDSLRRRR